MGLSFRAPRPVDTNSPVRRLEFRCRRSNSCHPASKRPSMAVAQPRFGSRPPSAEAGSGFWTSVLRCLSAMTPDRRPSCHRTPAIPQRALRLTVGYGCARRHPSLRIVSQRARSTQVGPFPRSRTITPKCRRKETHGDGLPRHGLNGITDRPWRDPQRGAAPSVD